MIINDPKEVFYKSKNIFIFYLNECYKDKSEINYFTYKIIKYIIYSFLCINNFLGKISLEEAYKIIEFNPDVNKKNYILSNLFKEFEFIQNDLLKIIGINNIVIFMNSIFDDISSIINNIEINTKLKEFKEIEKKLNEKINEKISKYKQSMEEYFSIIDKYNKINKINEDNNNFLSFHLLFLH